MNKLTKKQNESDLLLLLVSQRYLYKRSKSFSTIATIIALVVYLLSVTAEIHTINNTNLTYIFAFGLIMYHVVNQLSQKRTALAAATQELFDRKLYEMRISKTHLNFSEQSLIENALKIMNTKPKYYSYQVSNDGNKGGVKNWYALIDDHPQELSILFCQKENIMWDQNLRKNFLFFQIGLFVLFLSLVLYLFRNETISEVLIMTFGSISFIWDRGSKIYKNYTCYIEKKELRSILEDAFEQINKGDIPDLYHLTEDIQVRIYNSRKNNYMIPEWFYSISRNDDQKNSSDIIKQLSVSLLRNQN